MKWWVTDYQQDVALRMCSPTARLLWLECLFYMHTAKPYGHLVVSGNAAKTKQIAAFSNISASQIPKLLHELETANVLSYNENGIIFSRRMVRDKEASDRGRETGKTGGNPGLRGAASDAAQQPNPITPGHNPGGYAPGLSPEAEAEEEEDEDSQAAQNARAARGAEVSQQEGRGASGAGPKRALLPEALLPLVETWRIDDAGILRPIFGDGCLDSLAQNIQTSARFKPTWNKDWSTLAGWLSEGIDPLQILGAIKNMAAWPSYRPRTALEYYDKQVRKFRVKP